MKQKSNVWIFMLVAYGFSWLFWVPEALIAQGVWNAPEAIKNFFAAPGDIGPYGPLLAAIVVTLIYQGGAGVKDLLKRGLMLRLGKWWWVALLTFPVLIGGSLALSALFGNPLPEFEALAEPIALPFALVWIFFFSGPLQEEFGWRGYALENLRSKYDTLTAAIISGLMWGLWHLPLFFMPRADDYYNRPMWGLMLTTTLVGIILAWLYANTNGSIFATMLGHAMFNWSNWVLPALKSDSAALILFGLYFAAVAYIVWQYGRKNLTKTAN
ncbi:MAG TPA: type II CAAX endopeptidase family protein [Anaerolineales bacterium]|nr:type II CAAX endopeptidase family protein [Anaerolineales bacterium]